MDRDPFDAPTKASGANLTRRGILRALIGGLGAGALGTARRVAGADAKEKRQGTETRGRRPTPGTTPGASGPAVDRFVRCAKAQVGKPYVWATAGPDTFDCSGLVAFCYEEATGRAITRSSHAQFRLGGEVSGGPGRLAPGDLVFYDTAGDGAGHVGIVVGPERAVHALNQALGVRETGIDGAVLGGPYLGARRLDFADSGIRIPPTAQGLRPSGRAGMHRKAVRLQERRKRKERNRDARERQRGRRPAGRLEAHIDGREDVDASDDARAFYDSPGYNCLNDPFLLVRDGDGVACQERKPGPKPETDEEPLDG